MPNLLKQIPETMRRKGIPEETIALFNIPETGGAEAVMELIVQMDKLLSEEQRLSIIQEQGCGKTGNPAAPRCAFGIKYAGKTLAEKVELLNKANIPQKAPSRLNSDGTLSYWGAEDLRKKSCPCGFIRKLPDTFEVPKTFCGCCGGHIRSNYQKSLGVKLRLKESVSSSSSSGGKKRGEFLYEVEGAVL